MQTTYPKLLVMLLLAFSLVLSLPVAAQDDLPDAEIENDEGGVAIIKGQLNYTDPNLPTFGDQPMVFLGNMNGLFTGEFEFTTEYLDVTAPQTLGTITSSVFESPFSFELYLPIDPGGELFDVDNDDEDDAGIGVYSINFTFNGLGNQYVDEREFIYFRSYEMSLDYETLYDVIGGKILVYAPDDEQGFPAGRGDDGEMFTEDDPIVGIPAGWTVVDLETDPFTFDRSRVANVDVIESAGEEIPNFSEMGYVEAFDAMIDLVSKRYAYTEYKGLDWDEISATFRPMVEEAEANEDPIAFQLAIQSFVQSIPDGHFGIGSPYLNALPFSSSISGGLGLAVRELSDGRVIVNFVGEDSPAAEAGIELGAEITELNGTPIADAISAEAGLNPPYSGGALERLEQLRDVMRFEVGEEVELTFQNPDASEAETVTLTTVAEDESRLFSRESVYGPLLNPTLPLEYEVLDNGYGYIRIYSFSDNYDLSLSLWKRAMETMSGFGVPGIIIDMRYNTGGSPSISEPMIGYFIDEPLFTGTAEYFFEDVQEFRQDDLYDRVVLPAEESSRYYGDVAILISPACMSNCEFFTHAMSLLDNVTVIGHYPSGGLGGGIDYFFMPEGIFIQYPVQRNLGPDGEIIIEGMGVAPDVVVPVTEETLFSESDPLMDAAIEVLDEASAPETIEAGAIAVGEEVTDEIAFNSRMAYTLEVEEDATINISVGDEAGALDTMLTVFDADGNVIAENDDIEFGVQINSAIEGLEVSEGDVLTIEVATYADSGEGEYTLVVEAAE